MRCVREVAPKELGGSVTGGPRHTSLPAPRERYAAGKRLRRQLPRQMQGTWTIAKGTTRNRLRPIYRVNQGRLPKLLPEKYKRMRASPFAFFRGAAALMAADLVTTPRTGVTVQICGDAHVRNLGAYAALDGTLVFDLNDFDETIAGPWEWDVKRLATSLILAGEESGQSEAQCEASVRLFVRSYRTHLSMFATMRFATLGRYLISRRRRNPLLDAILRDAQRVTPMRNLEKLTIARGGGVRFHDRSPVLEHVSTRLAADVVRALGQYAGTLSASRRRTFERYRPIDVAFKLVGTGSVGTRDYLVLLFGNGPGDPLFIQVKQELPSCYEPYLHQSASVRNQGRRVAEGQQLLQTLSDPFLGYTRFGGHDYLVRQLADHKAAVNPAQLNRRTLREYAILCGEVLAKGHARTGDAALLAGYAGNSAKLDRAITAFAVTYAEQVRADYRLFRRPRHRKAQQRLLS
jgi:uncharacterized protein (DUF2252 family)